MYKRYNPSNDYLGIYYFIDLKKKNNNIQIFKN